MSMSLVFVVVFVAVTVGWSIAFFDSLSVVGDFGAYCGTVSVGDGRCGTARVID